MFYIVNFFLFLINRHSFAAINIKYMMIVAAVDVSGSIDCVPGYADKVYNVLCKLTPPIEVIRWNTSATSETYEKIVPDLGRYRGYSGTEPHHFVKLLSTTYPIHLYVFTDGAITTSDVDKCKRTLKEKNVEIQYVKLYFIGDTKDMNLKFIDVFVGIPQEIYINCESIGRVEPDLNFDAIDYDYIMKDDSFKATVLSKINSPHVDKRILKRDLSALNSRILKEYFKDKLTIRNFYEDKNIDDCVAYVKKHSYYNEKVDFQRKMSDIMKLFKEKIDTYSLDIFKKMEKPSTLEYTEPELECEYLTCDILYENCKTVCFPVKIHMNKTIIGEKDENSDNFCIDKKSIKNPFKLLESKYYRQEIANLVEPYTIDYQTYKRLENPNISPFTRNELQGVYVLHNDTINVNALIKHNNYILSTLFENKLPGKPVIWHMIFLYILAVDKLQDMKSRLFEEIRFLGNHSEYFITLSPHLNPPIVEQLNVCFWYIANVCHKAFPNSKKNLLRSPDFNSGVILKFYRDVFDENYEYPKEMLLWKLWGTLCDQPKLAIFNILAHYYNYENCTNVPESKFQIILYREPRSKEPPTEYTFLSQLSLKTVLNVYKKFTEASCPSYYDNVIFEEEDIVLNDDRTPDMLDHVEINLKTCHPYLTCPLTKKYWKDCIGEYNIMKSSYLRLFRRYCVKYKRYPESSESLLVYLNEYIFKRQEFMPELFPSSEKSKMEKVLLLFKEVMETYSCSEYLKHAEKYHSETIRSQYE